MKVRVEYAPVLENEVVLRCPRLDQEMLRVLSLVRSGLQKLCVWDENREIILLSPDETLYCESVDEHTFLYTASAFYQTALTLAELEGRYGELGYLRVSKSAVINLHRIRKDRYGKLWVTSRGDYNTIPSRLYVLDRKDKNSKEMVVKDTLDIPCSEMYIQGDSLYFYSVEWNKQTERNTVTYGIIDVRTGQLVTDHFITDGTEQDIVIPYGICVHPTTGDIYVTDAKNYVSSGVLHCYDRHGKKKWSVRTGDIPAQMAFYDPQ